MRDVSERMMRDGDESATPQSRGNAAHKGAATPGARRGHSGRGEAMVRDEFVADTTTVKAGLRAGETGGTRLQLLVDPPGGGAWNMAVDEVLLEDAAAAGTVEPTTAELAEFSGAARASAVLRIYRWSEPTLSLGYFQPSAARRGHVASGGCPIVRRASGGGAIVHDDELTYSLAVPAASALARFPESLYSRVHGSIARVLARAGVQTAPFAAGGAVLKQAAASKAFLCFQRRSTFDLVQGPRKIVGSAQRRRRGAVLQHGSILLGPSNFAPELAGPDYCGAPPAPALLAEQLWRELGEEFSWIVEPAQLSGEQLDRARRLSVERFGDASWTLRR
ncbi:MAG: hypothetical protein R3C10_19585 [Pirellulales bacterium]